MDDTSFLSADEIQSCVKRLRKRSAGVERGANSRINLAIFRLSCMGLRVCEIHGLNWEDLILDGPRPCIKIRPEITKGKNGEYYGRSVPLWWDKGTLEDLKRFAQFRAGKPGEPFLVSIRPGAAGQRLSKDAISNRWDTLMKKFGPGRARQLSIHKGRHSFISHSLAAGRSLVEVQRAAGHRSVGSTSVYLHFIEREGVPDTYGG